MFLNKLSSRQRGPAANGPRRRRITWAASLLLAMILLGYPMIDGSYLDAIATGAGASKTEILADGTILRVAPGTLLFVKFDGRERRLLLLKGKIFISAAHEPSRPLMVYSGETVAEAVGTKFSVSTLDGGIEVIVAEGIVSVSYSDGKSVRLYAGEKVVADASPLLKQRADVKQELKWSGEKISFKFLPVSQVIAEYNRRSFAQIPMPTDPALLAHKIFNDYDTAAPEQFEKDLELLSRVFKTRTTVEAKDSR